MSSHPQELQLPRPRPATSSLNIEHNERAFFKQPFYTAPLKGTIWTNSKERMQAAPSLIEKRGSKTIMLPTKFFTQIYKVNSWPGAHLAYWIRSFNLISNRTSCHSDAWKTQLQGAYLITDCSRETNEAQMDNLIWSWHSIPCIAQSLHPAMTQARYKTTPTTTPSTSATLPKSYPLHGISSATN